LQGITGNLKKAEKDIQDPSLLALKMKEIKQKEKTRTKNEKQMS
jgi:hypothetical protein